MNRSPVLGANYLLPGIYLTVLSQKRGCGPKGCLLYTSKYMCTTYYPFDSSSQYYLYDMLRRPAVLVRPPTCRLLCRLGRNAFRGKTK